MFLCVFMCVFERVCVMCVCVCSNEVFSSVRCVCLRVCERVYMCMLERGVFVCSLCVCASVYACM